MKDCEHIYGYYQNRTGGWLAYKTIRLNDFGIKQVVKFKYCPLCSVRFILCASGSEWEKNGGSRCDEEVHTSKR